MNKSYPVLLVLFLYVIFSGSQALGRAKSTFTEPANAKIFQAFKVTGKVTDSKSGESIIGATVLVKGTNNGTVTDVQGMYSITVSDANAILVFSYIGYEKQEIPVGDKTEINVSLNVATQELEQVVVIGYGVQKKVDLTGAVSTVDTKDMNLIPVSSVIQALQGKAAGVQIIQNSGSPGSSTTVNIRGMGTINNSEPLYVVDGMPVENISFVSMDDVKDISVLKDAASCAIYGSRGANGVILLTTKQGSKGSVKVDFTSSVSFNQFWKKYNLMDSTEWLATRKLYYQGTAYTNYLNSFTTKYGVNNWFNEVTNPTGVTSKINLTVSGGNTNTRYLISISNNSDQGIVKKASFRQTTVRVNLDNNLTDKLKLTTNLNFANSSRIPIFEGTDNIFQQVLRQPPVDRIYETLYENLGHPATAKDSVILGPSYNGGSLYAKLYSIENKELTNNLTTAMNLSYDITKNLTFTSRGSIYGNFFDGSYFNQSSKSYLYLLNNSDKNSVGDQTKSNQTYRWSWENIIHTNLKIGENHNFDFTGVASIEGQYFKETDASNYGYISDIPALQYLSAGNNIGADASWASMYTTASFVGRIIYDYADRYNLQLNARTDGSSIFSKSKRWGFFPSVSAGWSISNESFIKDMSLQWLSLLKFRASYGLLGNNRISEYSNYDLVKPNGYYIFGRSPALDMGWNLGTYGNPNIVWEKTNTFNLGFDLNLFKNQLTTSVDFFEKNTSDMLLQVPLPYSIGLGEGTNSPWQNTGEMQNKGMDLTVSYKQKIGDLGFQVSGNYTKVMNKVIKLGDRNEPVYGAKIDDYYISNYLGYLTYTAPGYPIGQFYGYKTDGIFSTAEAPNIPYTPQGYNTKAGINQPTAGDFKFKDLNGDGKIDNNDMTILGSPQPDFTYGFAFDFDFKGFDLNLGFQGSQGNKIFNVLRFFTDHYYSESPSTGAKPNNTLSGVENQSWTPSNQSAPFPEIKTNDFNNNYRASDFYVEDGSYLRLKTLTLGYTFSSELLQKAKIRNLRVYIGGYNLLTFTKYTGLDPEIGKDVSNTSNNLFFGVDRGTYPVARSYSFGIILGL